MEGRGCPKKREIVPNRESIGVGCQGRGAAGRRPEEHQKIGKVNLNYFCQKVLYTIYYQ